MGKERDANQLRVLAEQQRSPALFFEAAKSFNDEGRPAAAARMQDRGEYYAHLSAMENLEFNLSPCN